MQRLVKTVGYGGLWWGGVANLKTRDKFAERPGLILNDLSFSCAL